METGWYKPGHFSQHLFCESVTRCAVLQHRTLLDRKSTWANESLVVHPPFSPFSQRLWGKPSLKGAPSPRQNGEGARKLTGTLAESLLAARPILAGIILGRLGVSAESMKHRSAPKEKCP